MYGKYNIYDIYIVSNLEINFRGSQKTYMSPWNRMQTVSSKGTRKKCFREKMMKGFIGKGGCLKFSS